MKVSTDGKAKILTPDEIEDLFTIGFQSERDRALFGICLYAGCRISEALALRWSDVEGGQITLRKSTTKGGTHSRQMDIHPKLATLLEAYRPKCSRPQMFPGRHGRGRLSRGGAHLVLEQACHRCGIVGCSTHSFRRTALTEMSNAGIPLRHIQEISGHKSLAVLQEYLAVRPSDVKAAIAALPW